MSNAEMQHMLDETPLSRGMLRVLPGSPRHIGTLLYPDGRTVAVHVRADEPPEQDAAAWEYFREAFLGGVTRLPATYILTPTPMGVV